MEFSLTTFGCLALLVWFKCYLTDQVQQVSINNTLSDSVQPVISGIPQEVSWAPIISCLYKQYLF